MDKEGFVAVARQAEWEMTDSLYKEVMPLIYEVGKGILIGEVDVKPGIHEVLVYGEYCKRQFVLVFYPRRVGTPIPAWFEIKLFDAPASIPEKAVSETKRLAREEDLHIIFKHDALFLGTAVSIERTNGHVIIRSVLDRMNVAAERLEEISINAEDEEEEGAVKTQPKSRPGQAAALH